MPGSYRPEFKQGILCVFLATKPFLVVRAAANRTFSRWSGGDGSGRAREMQLR
jgi:hypothetical protein